MIYITSDHAGFAMKQEIIAYLKKKDVDYVELGSITGESVDYPVAAREACAKLQMGSPEDRGILICGTGIGISIAANKLKGIRAAVVHDSYTAEMCRRHNDANVICMGARVIGEGVALDAVHIFLTTAFEGGRHERRIDEIRNMER
ncbi:MAG: ribose 5-phosphate isomerase B [Ruminococcus sp.]|jgi:ribose 5-phosphate isomerase B|nr:ribose 5-phosphate isomerase B [Ruminococcus sp.]